MVRAKATAMYRINGFISALQELQRLDIPSPRYAHAKVDITFVVPDRRRRDKTNFASAFKAGLDGLVDAGIIKDDSYECCDDQYHIVYEKGVSKTIVEVSCEED